MHSTGDSTMETANGHSGARMPRILIGTPAYDQHEYCLDLFARSLEELEYSNCSVLLVDNSNDPAYERRIRKLGLPVVT